MFETIHNLQKEAISKHAHDFERNRENFILKSLKEHGYSFYDIFELVRNYDRVKVLTTSDGVNHFTFDGHDICGWWTDKPNIRYTVDGLIVSQEFKTYVSVPKSYK